MKTKFAAIAALGALSLAAIAPQAAAADNGFYLGAGITKSEFDVGGASDSLDDNSYKIIAGFRPLDWLAVEGNFIDLGGESDGFGTSLDAQAFTVSGLLIAEFAVIDLYARLGMANWKLDASLSGFPDCVGRRLGADLRRGHRRALRQHRRSRGVRELSGRRL
jgi:hypothetical protein